MRISDWSSDVCSSDLRIPAERAGAQDAGAQLPELCNRAGDDDGGLRQSEWRRFRVARQRCAASRRRAHRAGHRQSADLSRADRFSTGAQRLRWRSEEHTSELQSLMRTSYAFFYLKKKTTTTYKEHNYKHT